MAVIEGFRVQNYRALRDVTLGKLCSQQAGEPLTPFTVVIGKKRGRQEHLVRCIRIRGGLLVCRCGKRLRHEATRWL